MSRAGTEFDWTRLGDPAAGRPVLGERTSVLAYRLFRTSVTDELVRRLGSDAAHALVRAAGREAGAAFCRHALDPLLGWGPFLAQFAQVLFDLGIGVLRLERSEPDGREIVATIAEDLDCSGLPETGQTTCVYDEGFLAGVFEVYTGRPFEVQEVDCWTTGARTCRFRAVRG